MERMGSMIGEGGIINTCEEGDKEEMDWTFDDEIGEFRLGGLEA